MKKIFLLLISLLVTVISLSAQDYVRPSMEEVDEKLEFYGDRMWEAVENENYAEAVASLLSSNEYLRYLTSNDPDYWTVDYLIASNFYNLACYYNLDGKKEEALEALEKAYEYGYYKYAWAQQDEDLESLRDDEKFIEIIAKMREKGDYMAILQKCGEYLTENTSDYPAFEYEYVGNGRIQNVRRYLGLDTVVGNGDELSRIINLMTYVHNLIPHNGSHWAHCEHTAVDLYNYSKANDGQGVNCRQLAIVLNDCYLSMGFKSRFVTCMPRNEDGTDQDCHVINCVWSQELGKWLWMDPSFNAYVLDENGTPLSIREVRERMRDGRPYFLNEDANHNNETAQSKEHYLDYYMAKNLYWLQVPAQSYFCVESPYFNNNRKYVNLVPTGFETEYTGERYVTTSDPDYFWQAPEFDDEDADE